MISNGPSSTFPAASEGPLFEAIPLPLLHADAAGLVRGLNAAARSLWPGLAGQPVATLGPAAAALLSAQAVAVELPHPGEPGGALRARAQPLAAGWVIALHPAPRASAPAPDSAAQMAWAAELGQVAVWHLTLASGRVVCNQRAWNVLGLAPRADGLPLEALQAIVHPDDLPRVAASASQALASGRASDVEARLRRPDGSWRHVAMRRSVQRAADGSAVALVDVGLDLTEALAERRRADELTRRFDLVTRSAGIGWWMLEYGAERPQWSEQLRVIFGLAPGEPEPLLADWLERHVHPDDRAMVRDRYLEWIRSGREQISLHLRVLHRDGSERQVMTNSRRESHGPVPMVFGVVVDLTERRSAEHALRGAAERAALAARGVGLGTWELDLDSGHTFWDPQMWALRGRVPRSDSPLPEERSAWVHPDDLHLVEATLSTTLVDTGMRAYDFRVLWPDGSQHWLASRSVVVGEPGSPGRRRIGVNWDVTDRRTAEAMRHEREAAQRESLAKSKFLARMSHELRTPLNAVLGFSQLLLADENGSDAAAASRRRRLEHVRAAGQHLLSLIDDVLDLSSLEGGEVAISLQPVAVEPLVRQTLPLLEPLLGEGDARRSVAVHVGALPGHAMADATRLCQVLLNLLSNAVKYNRAGGEVHVESAVRGGTVVLRVRDTGRGMTDQQLRHLFEPFNRLGVQAEGPDGVEGSGIGLAIVKALVERMGGSVHVDSTAGVGSMFELRLQAAPDDARPAPPAGAALEPAAPAAPPAGPQPPRRRCVLYIEDNPVNAMIIGELLARRSDIALEIAVDGESGVAKATALRPDLVLLDMQLPDFDGFEVMRRLREQPATAALPVIALSANAMPDDIERALAAGMADYWTKPLDFKAFMASLDTLFGPAPEA